jgi:phage shock protein E
MIHTIKNFLGLGPQVDFAELVKKGAIILDVRSKEEFSNGHVSGSINIAVDQLSNNLSKLKKKDQAIITVCASGMRSERAKNILKAVGYPNVYNGGAWSSLANRIK